MRSSLIIIIAGLVTFHLGVPVFRVLAFPLAFLFFMIPLPGLVSSEMTLSLQNLASRTATWLLDLMNIPVIRDGNIIRLSDFSLGVTEACSGIRSLLPLLALAMAWAYVARSGLWSGLLFVLSAVPVAVIANAIRIVLIGVIGERYGVTYAEGFFHSFSGWVIFLIAVLCLKAVHSSMQLFSSFRKE
jgi:exosortase